MVDLKEVRAKAKEYMGGQCRVCPVCNGRACGGEMPGMGGAGTGATAKRNFDAWAEVKLNMRLVHDATDPDLSWDFLGRKLSLPVLAAPVAGLGFNFQAPVSEPEYVAELLAGCLEAGILGGAGAGVRLEAVEANLEVVRKLNGAGILYTKPWAEDRWLDELDRIAAAGCDIVGTDIDSAGLVTLAMMGSPVQPKTVEQLKRAVDRTKMKYILKGIMTVDDALASVEAGAAAIVVSNHGGRVLDHQPGTAEVMPAIAEAVKGKIAILIDGAIRTGVDILKALALGADGVMIGRPMTVAAVGGGREGVVAYVNQLRGELLSAMIVTGCRNLKEIGPQVIYKG